MNQSALALIIHQFVFQGMFFAKNFFLRRKLGKPVRGTNIEANVSVIFFATFIGLALYFALSREALATLPLVPIPVAQITGCVLMIASIIVAFASLWHLGDSWRVGVIDEQATQLIQSGIYRYSRNPYFLAYLLMFAAYTIFLQNIVLLVLSVVGFCMIHIMVNREEAYLAKIHGNDYRQYKKNVPRYLPILKPLSSLSIW